MQHMCRDDLPVQKTWKKQVKEHLLQVNGDVKSGREDPRLL